MADRKSITATQVLDLVQSQDYVCAISGRTLTPETASIDHIVPLGRGGEHAIENVWVVDHQVNLAKGTMTVEEFVSMREEVVAYQNTHRGGKSGGNGTEKAQMVPSEKMLF